MNKDFPLLAFPERLTIEITNTCNLACIMCPRHNAENGTGFMQLDLYRNIIEEARHHLSVTLVPFFRGEPLLHPDLFEMIEIASKSGLGPIQLATNATLLNEDTSTIIIKSRLDFLSFSIDIDKKNYKSTHVGGDYEKVINNIDNFIAIKKTMNTNKPEIQVSTVETTENRHGLHEFAEYWLEKVDRVRIYPAHSTNGAFGSLESSNKYPDFEQRLPCKKVFNDIVIYWDGTVAVCNHDWNRREYIGNIIDNSIQEVWSGKKYNEIRKRHIKGKLENDQTCKECDHWKMYYIKEGSIGKLYEKQNKALLH
ncbi:MAG: radical SAM protein [Candidatus Scalindua sp.]|jgi:radical SAM protein with 4Fe4S-binding SPASM domain|nr:radical SAM protein [Candidatus Scalindua sp.]